MKSFKDYLLEEEQANETPSVGDIFEFEIARDETLIETTIVDVLEDGVVLNADATAWSIFESAGYFVEYKQDGPIPSGGHMSAMGSDPHKKVNRERSSQDEMYEGFPPNSFEGENEDFGLGTLRYKAVVDDDGRVQVIHDSITVETGGPNSPEEFRELSAEDQIYALEAAQEDAEEVWSERDDKYAHYVNEGKVKDLLMDIQELSDKEFQEKYNMSKAEAKEKFNLDEADESWTPRETTGTATSPDMQMAVDKARYAAKDKLGGEYNPLKMHEKKKVEAVGGKYKATVTIAPRSDANTDNRERQITGMQEAEYRGRKVPLGKPMRGDVKKFKVYVKDPKTGNVKKVNFGHGGTSAKRAGQKTMSIKKSNPARRKSFRARHNCSNPGPRTKARYWSCRAW